MIPQKNPLIASGESVHANMFFKLWENPDPSSTFASQPITLSSSDYDFVLLIGRLINGSARDISVIAPNGDSAYFVFSTYSSGAAHSATRLFTYTDDTHLAVSDASVDSSTNNAYLIPVAIYGFKKSLDITAIVSNVSTDARKCYLSDGVTSVEDKLDALSEDWELVYSSPSDIAVNASASVDFGRDLSKYRDIAIMVSYNQAFTYVSCHIVPFIKNVSVRLYHFVNSGSAGPFQITFSTNSTGSVNNGVNEAVKFRVYVR